MHENKGKIENQGEKPPVAVALKIGETVFEILQKISKAFHNW